MFSDIMLVCDMDGTLLGSDSLVSRENREALERFTSQGGKFTIATGRTFPSLSRYLSELPVNVPLILYNGAIIADHTNGSVLWENPLPDIAEKTVREIIAAFPETGVEIYGLDHFYCVQENELTREHIRNERIDVSKYALDQIPFPWIKVIIADDNAKLQIVKKWLDEKNLPFRSTFSYICYLELLENHASKGHALLELSRITGIPVKNIFAMGDNLNDLEMIQMAGKGIAVKNAHPELKKAAAVCMPHHDEHAVAHVVEWIERAIR